MTTRRALTSQEVVERALELSRTDGCVVLVDDGSSANLRWAANNLTTNGVMRSRSVTVVAVDGAGTGAAAGVVSRSTVTADGLEPLVRAAERAARDNGPAEDARPLVPARADDGWADPPGETSIRAFAELAPALGDRFGVAAAGDRLLYGFVQHAVTTTYLGSSEGLRLRHEQPSGFIGMTGKSRDLSRSSWVGRHSRDMTDVDVTELDAELARRLGWARRTVDLPAGRYDTVLPPSAVADIMVYAYWAMGARDAHDGRTVYSRPGAGTRVGERLSRRPVTLSSDPAQPGLSCAPFVVAHSSSSHGSVFDNGLPLGPVTWVRDGELSALVQTRHSADLTGLAVTPAVDNLTLEVQGATGTTDDLAAELGRGLLLTSLWYIREVDPQTLLLTGLTRDGVYLVEGGEVVGAVNNFRFNESPVSLLDRVVAAGSTGPALGRSWGDYFPRTRMPPLRVADFAMSSVSRAS
ncbi:MAG TPA: metallopeptidase TldD-related protein [Jiangellales bacterium]|nr:metallopeptidase TldD-related protein [Jiangellales bacterium]